MKHATVPPSAVSQKSAFHTLSLVLLLGLLTAPAHAQSNASVYAEGLVAPTGLETDSEGRVWVAEQGTGSDDSRISVITPDGTVYPFATGLRSIISPEGMGEGVTHLKLYDGDLWAVAGLTNAPRWPPLPVPLGRVVPWRPAAGDERRHPL